MKAVRVFLILMLILVGLTGASIATGAQSSPEGTILFVDWEAPGANDGSSWEDAFTDLQPALEAAVPGDQIWVAAGTYYPSVEVGGAGDRYKTFQMRNGVGIYGGFDPSTGDVGWDDRDWVANEVILSGDIGVPGDPADNCYHVFFDQWLYLDASAVLDGFTVTGGNADGGGGGMYNSYSDATLANCRFVNNSASGDGGAIWNMFSSSTLSNCTFENNSASGNGGAVYNHWYADVTLTDCTLTGNSAAGSGGGMYNNEASPTLTRCSFQGNTASGDGGGMDNGIYSYPTLSDCTFSGNSAHQGGGIYNAEESEQTLTNCLFEGNSAVQEGGGLYEDGAASALTNCTMVGNTASIGGGIYSTGFYLIPTLANCVLWGDAPDELHSTGAPPSVTYSDIQGGYAGEGNIDADPLWVDPVNGDYHLSTGSPCIDAGTNLVPNLPPFDFEGDPRVMDGDGDGTAIVDMGIDEVLGPSGSTLHIANIQGWFSLDPYGRYLLRVKVIVHDQDHNLAGDVAVDASIWSPAGGPYARTRMTKPTTGTASFPWGCNVAGTWQLCVDDLAKAGYTYDPASNDVPSCASWNN